METITYQVCPLCKSEAIRFERTVKDHSISQEEFDLFRCEDCSFLFTQDVPPEEGMGKYYESEDYISHSDTREGLINRLYHRARQYMLARKFKLIKRLGAGKSLLDVGCGTGYFLDYMQHKGYRGTGVEVDERARQFGRDRFGLQIHPPEELLQGRIEGPFDFITLWHVLEHLHDLHGYMKLFDRLLAEDGYLLIAVPNHRSHDSQKYASFWAGYDVPRHLWHFSPDTLELLAGQHGFRIEEMRLMPLDPFYNAMLSEKYRGQAAGLVSGGFTGLTALLKGVSDTRQASSIIYLLRKS